MKEKKEIKKMKKVSNKGITLIALVITIIVLLILAAVSIATLTGDNGILTKADTAKTQTTEEQEREEVKLAYGAAVAEKLSKGDTSNVTASELNAELSKQNTNATAADVTTAGDIDVTFSETKHKYTVHQNGDEKGKITGPEEGEVSEDNSIPMAEAKQKEKFATKTEVKAEDNQIFPVPAEFKIATDSADRVEEGVVIEDTREETEGSQFVWIPVKNESDYARNPQYVNFGVLENWFDDEDYLPDGITNEKQAVLEAEGFYISRFEAGKETKDGKDTLVSKSGATVWVSIPQEDCKKEAKTFINNSEVKSALISGTQWDVVMKFIGDDRKDGKGNTFDVTTKDDSRHTESKATSGQNEADKVCNIYDLEGNCCEYVAEKNDYDTYYPYVFRGGDYRSYHNPASYRNFFDGNAYGAYSFRLVLYVM